MFTSFACAHTDAVDIVTVVLHAQHAAQAPVLVLIGIQEHPWIVTAGYVYGLAVLITVPKTSTIISWYRLP